ncbi:MAG TPA: signal peptidase I [Thermoanaerobaculia bacterium]|nr:signal peptidase I [Thermoanaerobaculia bacterium]
MSPNIYFVQRVVAVAGDTVQIRNKQLYLNGKLQNEPYAVHRDPAVYSDLPSLPEPYHSRDQFGPYTVPANSYFVLGDNRDESSDSRYWGAVPARMVMRRAGTVGGWWKH